MTGKNNHCHIFFSFLFPHTNSSLAWEHHRTGDRSESFGIFTYSTESDKVLVIIQRGSWGVGVSHMNGSTLYCSRETEQSRHVFFFLKSVHDSLVNWFDCVQRRPV